jgi:tubulin polyglutamylase TTLL4
LTNFSVNKRNADYQYNNTTEADADGEGENSSKWSLKTLR